MAKRLQADVAELPQGCYIRIFRLENVRTFRSPVVLDFCHANGCVAQWTVILGENGAGKTTLLQYLAGMAPTNKIRPFEKQKKASPSFGPALLGDEWEFWHIANLSQSESEQRSINASLYPSKAVTCLTDACEDASPSETIKLWRNYRYSKNNVEPYGHGIWSEHEDHYASQFRFFGYGAGRHIAGGASPYLTSENFFDGSSSQSTVTL